MLIGTGLLAQAFLTPFAQREDVCIYAAGVSNSGCTSSLEFERERKLLTQTLLSQSHVGAFVYFGTCSVRDPVAKNTPYVRHKLAMEHLVAAHPRHLILRLPQIAGRTPNPHTLLNYLYARISRSEGFELWKNAKRNIIDIDDVAAIAGQIIADKSLRNLTLNIANPVCDSIVDIVAAMERAVGKPALCQVIDLGSGYQIDVSAISGMAAARFGHDYLERVIGKYYAFTGV
ncbi:MAG: NAD-dependent epimerase/dehydratase family protein [Verrucomicrobiota bacterium]